MLLLIVTSIIITPVLAFIIWRDVLSLNTKSKIRSGHWFLIVALALFLGWYSIKRYEANGLINAFEYEKSSTVNGLKNPLGLEKIKSFHSVNLTRDYGEAEERDLGYIAIYQVNNVVSNMVLKTKGKYLSFADIPAHGKHWIVDSRHPEISCYPNKHDYHWQPIFQAPQILIQHTNLTEKDVFQVVEKYLKSL
ncbi:hypothetical protein FK216_15315 [Moraxellaceae bacterium AER2_44_116]|nr:hypothetical protein [Moraxellaceae bacterium]TQC94901.1 hypothetical protein FK216_15315 [Moraxellaceae bacterium AER2_44_116]